MTGRQDAGKLRTGTRCSINAITLSPLHLLAFGEMGMADHAELEYASATGNDYLAHEQTYRNFITLVKVSLAIVVVILLLLAYFLT
jgi:hypothetical protein